MHIFSAPVTTSKTRVVNGVETTDHRFQVPLNYDDQTGEQIEVFARELATKGASKDLPWMVYFQGGPGFGSPRVHGTGGWVGEVLKTHRLLLLDQRGTGLSTRVLAQTLATRGDAAAQAEYLTHFRADNIVKDSEAIRRTLVGEGKAWKGIGQSYGGFCLLTYLSFYPDGLSGVIITGGVACVKRKIEDNYRLTYQKVLDKNKLFYQRYPEHKAQVREIVDYIRDNDVMLPSGVRLSVRRFQQLGMMFGASGGFESMHFMLEEAFVEGVNGRELSYNFLVAIERASSFETNPIFCILHESIYGEGYATNWAAERLRNEFPQVAEDAEEFVFTGEMISPSMLDDYKELQSMKEVAQILAEKADWGALYDLDQLAKNTVPVSAISFYDDMYVPIEWSEETAQHTGNFRIWVTNEWEHNGIGVEGPRIVSRLLSQLDEPAPYGLR